MYVGCRVHAATGWLYEQSITQFNLTGCRHVVHLIYLRQNSERITLLGNCAGKMLLSIPRFSIRRRKGAPVMWSVSFAVSLSCPHVVSLRDSYT